MDLVNDTKQLTVPEAGRRYWGCPAMMCTDSSSVACWSAGPSQDGAVYVSAASVDEYRAKPAAERVIEA